MTTRQRYKHILSIIEGISKIERMAAQATADRSAIDIFTRAYAGLLGDALRVDPTSQYIHVHAGQR